MDKSNYVKFIFDDTTIVMPGFGAAGYVIRPAGGNLELDIVQLGDRQKSVTCRMLVRKEENKLTVCYSYENMKRRPDQVAPGKDLYYIEAIQSKD